MIKYLTTGFAFVSFFLSDYHSRVRSVENPNFFPAKSGKNKMHEHLTFVLNPHALGFSFLFFFFLHRGIFGQHSSDSENLFSLFCGWVSRRIFGKSVLDVAAIK